MVSNSVCNGCFRAYTGPMKSAINDTVMTVECIRRGELSQECARKKVLKHRRSIEHVLSNQIRKAFVGRINTQQNIYNTLVGQPVAEQLEAFENRIEDWADFINKFEGNKIEKRLKFKKSMDNFNKTCDDVLKERAKKREQEKEERRRMN